MNSYCIEYNKHLMFAKPTLAPASVAICKLALNEVNLGLDMRTIRYALGIGQDMLKRKFSSITTDSFKLKFTKDAKLGRKFTQELIRLVAKGILIPSQTDNLARVYHQQDGTFVQKWELTKALSEDVLEQPYLNTFFVHMNKKGKTETNFPPWEDRNYKFSIDHSKGDPHKVYEQITEPKWTEEDLNMINSKDDWKVLQIQEVVVSINQGSVHYITEIVWAFVKNIFKNRLIPGNALDKEVKRLMLSITADCESILTTTDISPDDVVPEEIKEDFNCNSLEHYNGSYACPSPTENLYHRVSESRLLLDHFKNIRIMLLIKYINSEYTKGYKDILLKYDKLTPGEDVVSLKFIYNEREKILKGFISFYEVKKGEGLNIDCKARPQSKTLRKRYKDCSSYIKFEQNNNEEEIAEEEIQSAESSPINGDQKDPHNLLIDVYSGRSLAMEVNEENAKSSINIASSSKPVTNWSGSSVIRKTNEDAVNKRLKRLRAAVTGTLNNKRITGKPMEMTNIVKLYQQNGLVEVEEALETATEGRIIKISHEDYNLEENKPYVSILKNDGASEDLDLVVFNTCLVPEEDYNNMKSIIDILTSAFKINIVLVATEETTNVKSTKFKEDKIDFRFMLLVAQFFTDLMTGTSTFNKFVPKEGDKTQIKKYETLNTHFIEIIRKIKNKSSIRINFPVKKVKGQKITSGWIQNRTMRFWYRFTNLLDTLVKPHLDLLNENIEIVENKFPRKLKLKVNRVNIKKVDECLTPSGLALIVGNGESHLANLVINYIKQATGNPIEASTIDKFGKEFTKKYVLYSETRNSDIISELVALTYKVKRLFYVSEDDTIGVKIYKVLRRMAFDRKEGRKAKIKVIVSQNRNMKQNESSSDCVRRVLKLMSNASDQKVEEELRKVDNSIFAFSKYLKNSFFVKTQVWYLEVLISLWQRLPYGMQYEARNRLLNFVNTLFLPTENFRQVKSIDENISIKVYSIGHINGILKSWASAPNSPQDPIGMLSLMMNDNEGLLMKAMTRWHRQLFNMVRVTDRQEQTDEFNKTLDHMISCGLVKESQKVLFSASQ